MIKISGLNVPSGADMEHVIKKAAHILKIKPEAVHSVKVLKRSTDARKKNCVLDVYTITLCTDNEKKTVRKCGRKNVILYEEETYHYPSRKASDRRSGPVIAGFGPSGIFAALILAHEGYAPTVYERGKCIEDRAGDVERFFETGVLDPESNVQFGEGGAGTFSDGKLSTGVRDREGRKEFILNTFIRHGADADILTEQHPHIGTDRLMGIIASIRREIETLGGEIHFNTALTGIDTSDGQLTGIRLSGDREGAVPCQSLFLCPGHSARDTLHMLYNEGVLMEARPFAAGVRAEHRRSVIDGALHQDRASYKLTYRCKDGRGVYSFCMCPGGYVVNASSEKGYLTVNGMSYSDRDGVNSNAAIVCTISPEDYAGYGEDPLCGIRFQRELERKAYEECQGFIPYQKFSDFAENRITGSFGSVKPACKGKYRFGNIRNILPSFIADDIIEAVPEFGKKIEGYDDGDMLLAGIEARTSSPVRIIRNSEDMQSVSIRGIYPAGEGAGYAGGIMSAAIDGMKAAEAYIST